MKFSLLSFLILLFAIQTAAAQFNEEAFLNAAVGDDELVQILAAQEYVASNNFRSPLFRELELRFRSNNRNATVEDYRLRFGLINPMEIRANRQYEQQLKRTIEVQKQLKLNEILYTRYILLIEHVQLKHQLQNLEKLAETYRVLRELAYREPDPEQKINIIDVESDLFKVELDLNDLRQKMIVNELLIRDRLEFEGTIEIDTSRWMSPAEINPAVLAGQEDDLKLKVEKEKQNLARQEFKVEEAEAWSNLGFIQAEYDEERGNTEREHLGFMLGLRIPLFNPDRPDLRRDELDLVEDEAKFELEKKARRRQRDILILELQEWIVDLETIQQKRAFLTNFDQIVAEPSIELARKTAEFKAFVLNKEINAYTRLLRQVIQIRYLNGELADKPVRNMLEGL